MLGVYVIYDKAAGESGPMFQAISDAIALRSTEQALKNVPPHLLPEYQLIRIADYDPKTLEVFALPAIEIDFTAHFKHVQAFYDANPPLLPEDN